MHRRFLLIAGSTVPFLASQPWLQAALLPAETLPDETSAGPLFQAQGEYLGVLDAWGGTWGAQLIAEGERDLKVHLLSGGLPGDGFKDREPTKQCKAVLDGKTASGKGDGFSVSVDGHALVIADPQGTRIGSLSKILRESKTLGMDPPKDALVLFDGSSTDKFKDGKLVDEKFLGVGCTSLDTFEDHSLHLEFLLPFQPGDFGQARANSGVYVQGRYEVQVLDSFGLHGENNECGGLYTLAQPRLNMCYPPLSWQTYDIDFRAAKFDSQGKKESNARISVRHNGVLIHDDFELPKASPGSVSDESGQPGPLFLQDHSNPVVYRNIWVVTAPKATEGRRPKGRILPID